MAPPPWTPLDVANIIRAALEHARRHPAELEAALRSLGDLAEELAPAAGPLKVCAACGARYDREAWSALRYVGIQEDSADRWELRDCRCGSTIGVCLGPSVGGVGRAAAAPAGAPSPEQEAAVRAVLDGLGGDPADEPLVRQALGVPGPTRKD